jgi:hypothetical protein
MQVTLRLSGIGLGKRASAALEQEQPTALFTRGYCRGVKFKDHLRCCSEWHRIRAK